MNLVYKLDVLLHEVLLVRVVGSLGRALHGGLHHHLALEDALLLEQLVYSGHEVTAAEGLCYKGVGSALYGCQLVFLGILCREHDDGYVADVEVLSYVAQQLHAVQPREHHIQYDQGGPLGGSEQGLPEIGAVLKTKGLKARGAQGIDLDIPDAGVVFHAPDHCVIPPCVRRSRRRSPTGQYSPHGRQCVQNIWRSSADPAHIPLRRGWRRSGRSGGF